MQTAVASNVALKEWAVTVQALAQGKQIVLLRKGGIREENREFRVEHQQFLLYPTYEHQRADLLQPPYRPDLEAVLQAAPPADHVRLEYWAEITDIYETFDAAAVEALAPHYIWTPNYAEERLRWRPKKPLYVLLVRVYRLPAAQTLPVLPSYGGCKSWVELERPLMLEGLAPVLDDAAYDARRAAVRAALGR
ncbi:MAG TPA: DUF1802 family protein [Chloroflexota bacterium]|nr:DUF1802 family protein [Chloroflexota bacterium]